MGSLNFFVNIQQCPILEISIRGDEGDIVITNQFIDIQ